MSSRRRKREDSDTARYEADLQAALVARRDNDEPEMRAPKPKRPPVVKSEVVPKVATQQAPYPLPKSTAHKGGSHGILRGPDPASSAR